MFTSPSSSLTVNIVLSPSPSWHDTHLFWRLALKVGPSSLVRGGRCALSFISLYITPPIVASGPAGIQNIPSNILLCHIVTGWAASIAINFSTKTYCNSNQYLGSIDTAYCMSTWILHKYWILHILYLFLSQCACNDNEWWCNLAIPDSILTGLTWLITTVVSGSLHQGSLSHRDTLVLKSMNVFTASWSSKKTFKVSNLLDYTWYIPWMRGNYLIFTDIAFIFSEIFLSLLFSKQNKSNKWNRKVGSRGSSRNTFQVIKSPVVQTYRFTSKYSIYESESDAGDGTLIVSQFSSESCVYCAWGCSGRTPRRWRGSSCRGQGGQTWTCGDWSNNTPHAPHRPGDTGASWELTPGSWLPDLNRIIVTMCVLSLIVENNK